MIQRVLSFDQAPPLSVPLRFFLSAPLFLIAAAMLLVWEGPDALVSRWSPIMLALTHLLTLGVLTMTMIGALIQILPVVAGILIPREQLTAGVVYALLTAGTLLLTAAFWWMFPVLFKLALLCLVVAFGWLLTACAMGLWQSHAANATGTVIAIRLAVVALLVTIILGAALGSGFALSLSLPLMQLTDLHVLWGLSGWVGLLMIGIAFQVIPMFQVTPIYPQQLTRTLAWVLFILMIMRSLATVILQEQSPWITDMLSALILIAFVLFAATTLYLLWRRKRPKADATTLFWRTSMASLLGCAAMWSLSYATGQAADTIALGMLFVIGFAFSAINGMLYKIVPFLLWYHAQSEIAPGSKNAVSVRLLLPDSVAIKQFWVHIAGLLLLLAATGWPVMARPAAIVVCISAGWLEWNLMSAVRIYWRAKLNEASTLVGS